MPKRAWAAAAATAAVLLLLAGSLIRPAGAVPAWRISPLGSDPVVEPFDSLRVVKENAGRYRPLTAFLATSYKLQRTETGRSPATVTIHSLYGIRIATASANGAVEVAYE